jgi:hypothetical protein
MRDEILAAALEEIIETLKRIEARQKVGLAEIKEAAPPVTGTFGSIDPGK